MSSQKQKITGAAPAEQFTWRRDGDAVSAGCGRRNSRDLIPRRSASRIPESPAGGVNRQVVIDKAAARFRRREHCALISVKRRQVTPKIVSKRFCGDALSEIDIPRPDSASHLCHIVPLSGGYFEAEEFLHPPRNYYGRRRASPVKALKS